MGVNFHFTSLIKIVGGPVRIYPLTKQIIALDVGVQELINNLKIRH